MILSLRLRSRGSSSATSSRALRPIKARPMGDPADAAFGTEAFVAADQQVLADRRRVNVLDLNDRTHGDDSPARIGFVNHCGRRELGFEVRDPGSENRFFLLDLQIVVVAGGCAKRPRLSEAGSELDLQLVTPATKLGAQRTLAVAGDDRPGLRGRGDRSWLRTRRLEEDFCSCCS
jgi:hypothetical protein